MHFSHPLLARSVYTDAGPARRRRMHRALADVVTLPELRARHLGLATTRADPETLQALDEAADAALARGAPAAAAELIELAIRLGGDTSSRRIRAAQHRFQAGDTDRARAVLAPTIDAMEPGPLRAIAFDLLAGMRIYDNDFLQAADRLEAALDDAKSNPVVLVQTLLMLSFVQLNSDEYGDSLRHARQAVTVAEGLDIPTLTSQALAMWVRASFTYGQGFDESALKRALELEDPHVDVPIPFRASAINALILACTGRLDEARAQACHTAALRRTRRRRRHRGHCRIQHVGRYLAGTLQGCRRSCQRRCGASRATRRRPRARDSLERAGSSRRLHRA